MPLIFVQLYLIFTVYFVAYCDPFLCFELTQKTIESVLLDQPFDLDCTFQFNLDNRRKFIEKVKSGTRLNL